MLTHSTPPRARTATDRRNMGQTAQRGGAASACTRMGSARCRCRLRQWAGAPRDDRAPAPRPAGRSPSACRQGDRPPAGRHCRRRGGLARDRPGFGLSVRRGAYRRSRPRRHRPGDLRRPDAGPDARACAAPMFVVPTGTAPIVQHSSADAVAVRLRRALVRELGSVVEGADHWLAEVEASVVGMLRESGGATGAALSRADPRLRTRIVVAEGKSYGGPVTINSRVLNLLSAQGRIVRGRPGGGWTGSLYEWAPAENWLGTRPEPSAPPMPGPRWSGSGLPGSARRPSPTSSGGPAGPWRTPDVRWRRTPSSRSS